MDWMPGDLLFCYGGDMISRVISWGTTWPIDPWSCWRPPSHVGMIVSCGRFDRVLIESTSLCQTPCLAHGVRRAGIQIHTPEERIEDYTRTGGEVEVYRLSGLHRLSLDHDLLERLAQRLLHEQAPYDTLGALVSGTRLSGWLRCARADLSRLFCSEMVAALLMSLGMMNQENPRRYSPGRLLRELRRTGHYRRVRRHTTRAIHYDNGPELRVHHDA